MEIYSINGKTVNAKVNGTNNRVLRKEEKGNKVPLIICTIALILSALTILGVVVYLLSLVSWILAIFVVAALVFYIAGTLYDDYKYRQYE